MYNFGVTSNKLKTLSVLCLFILPVIISGEGNQDADNIEKRTQDNINLRGREESVLKIPLTNSDEVVTVDIHAPPVVEVALVCSKEFSDNFGHNRQRILDFFSAYFWDVSLQFRTLPSSRIHFTLTSLTLISSKEEQAFIEDARDPVFGNASLIDIIHSFRMWITQKSNELPRFNAAILVTEPAIDKDIKGVARMGGMCGLTGYTYNGIAVLRGDLKAGAHEIAHLLGARHDDDDDDKSDRSFQFIMNRASPPLEMSHFFSLSSDDDIREFLESRHQLCLKIIPTETPLIDTDFDSVLPPTIQEQCRLLTGDRNAYPSPGYVGDCAMRKCFYNHSGNSSTFLIMAPLSNSKCERVEGGSGRCFRGRCVSPGSLLQNVGAKMCLLRPDTTLKLEYDNHIIMEKCPRSSTPLERFNIIDVNTGGNGAAKMLEMPCQNLFSSSVIVNENSEYRCLDKCLSAQFPGGFPHLAHCNEMDDFQKWEFIDINSNGEFFLYNVRTGTYAKQSSKIPVDEPTGTLFNMPAPTVVLVPELNKSDPDFRWKLNQVMPEPGMCPNEDNCVARLQPKISLKFNSSTNLGFLNISLLNLEGVAISPAALISWKSNITLLRKPDNCISFPPGLKCKVGRLLKTGETFLVAKLEFDTTYTNVSTKLDLQEQLKINVTATMAKSFDTSLNRDNTKEQNSENSSHFMEIIFILMLLFILLLIIPTIIQRFLHSKICRLLRLEV